MEILAVTIPVKQIEPKKMNKKKGEYNTIKYIYLYLYIIMVTRLQLVVSFLVSMTCSVTIVVTMLPKNGYTFLSNLIRTPLVGMPFILLVTLSDITSLCRLIIFENKGYSLSISFFSSLFPVCINNVLSEYSIP